MSSISVSAGKTRLLKITCNARAPITRQVKLAQLRPMDRVGRHDNLKSYTFNLSMPGRFIHKLKIQDDRCPNRTKVADTSGGSLPNASQRDTFDPLALGSLTRQNPYAACIDHHAAPTFLAEVPVA